MKKKHILIKIDTLSTLYYYVPEKPRSAKTKCFLVFTEDICSNRYSPAKNPMLAKKAITLIPTP